MKNEINGIRPLPTVPFTKEKSCRIVIIYIYIDLMVVLRYGFYPRVTDVISQMSEVLANE